MNLKRHTLYFSFKLMALSVYTPSAEELGLTRSQTLQPTVRLEFMVLLNTFQHLAYFIPIDEVLEAILNYLMACLEFKL